MWFFVVSVIVIVGVCVSWVYWKWWVSLDFCNKCYSG